MKCPECGVELDSPKHQMSCVLSTLGSCAIREHVGIEKLLQKIGMGQPLMPDPELGQDVAFLAHVITTLTAENERHRAGNTGLHKEVTAANLQLRAMVEERDLYSDVVDSAESWLRHHGEGSLAEAEANKALKYQVERLGPKVAQKQSCVAGCVCKKNGGSCTPERTCTRCGCIKQTDFPEA